jgi:hypothetical protein
LGALCSFSPSQSRFAADRLSAPLTSKVEAVREQQISRLHHDTSQLSDHMARVQADLAKARAEAERAFAIAAAATERAARLARISHKTERIGAPNQRKWLCHNNFRRFDEEPRCRQSVAHSALILEWWKRGLWKLRSMAA